MEVEDGWVLIVEMENELDESLIENSSKFEEY